MTLLLNSFSFVPLLVRICAEMDDTPADVIQSREVINLSLVGDARAQIWKMQRHKLQQRERRRHA